MTDEQNKPGKNHSRLKGGHWVAVGAGVGAAIGAATGEIGISVAGGVAVGLVIFGIMNIGGTS